MSFETKIETVGKDILHVVEAPFTFLVKTEKVLQTAIKDQPALAATLKELIAKFASVEGTVVSAGQGSGLNLTADASALAAVEDLFSYFKTTVVPEIESVYTEIKAEV